MELELQGAEPFHGELELLDAEPELLHAELGLLHADPEPLGVESEPLVGLFLRAQPLPEPAGFSLRL